MDLNDILSNENERDQERNISRIERETQINRNLIFSNKYERAIQSLGENKECTRTIIQCARTMLDHCDGTKYEDLYFIDITKNIYKCRNDYRVEELRVEPTKEMLKMLENGHDIIGIHNHPNSTIPSLDDFHVCQKRGYKYGLIVCHNGTIYQYQHTGKLNDVNIYCSQQAFDKAEYNSLRVLHEFEDINIAHAEHMNILKSELLSAGIKLEEVLYDKR